MANVIGAAADAGTSTHARWVRISHWIVAGSFITLAVPGYVILMAHPVVQLRGACSIFESKRATRGRSYLNPPGDDRVCTSAPATPLGAFQPASPLRSLPAPCLTGCVTLTADWPARPGITRRRLQPSARAREARGRRSC
jgi:hypothetical protein